VDLLTIVRLNHDGSVRDEVDIPEASFRRRGRYLEVFSITCDDLGSLLGPGWEDASFHAVADGVWLHGCLFSEEGFKVVNEGRASARWMRFSFARAEAAN
jgi:hypothetical protein